MISRNNVLRVGRVYTLDESIDPNGEHVVADMIIRGSQVIAREFLDDGRIAVTLVNDYAHRIIGYVERELLSDASWTGQGSLGRYYLGGPMTGISEHNYPAFHEAARKLREIGYEIVSPAELNYDAPKSIELVKNELSNGDAETKSLILNKLRKGYLKRDIHFLSSCEGVILLPGWTMSDGTVFEYSTARELGMDILHYINIIKE